MEGVNRAYNLPRKRKEKINNPSAANHSARARLHEATANCPRRTRLSLPTRTPRLVSIRFPRAAVRWTSANLVAGLSAVLEALQMLALLHSQSPPLTRRSLSGRKLESAGRS